MRTKNKKGFFFTMLAILLVSVFVIIFTTHTTIPQQSSFGAAQTEASRMNSFTKEVSENHIETAMKAAGQTAVHTALEYISLTGDEMTQTDIKELAENGVIGTDFTKDYLGEDLYFTMVFQNKTETATDINTLSAATTTIPIGGKFGVLQGFYVDTTQRLKQLTISVVNDSGLAESDHFIAAIYEAPSNTIIGYADTEFKADGDLTFTFEEQMFLDSTKRHDVYIFAPYTNDETYLVSVTTTNIHLCPSFPPTTDCDKRQIEYEVHYSTSPPGVYFPADIHLNEPMIGGNSFRALIGRLELMASNYLNIDTNIEYENFDVEQEESPWEVEVEGDVTINTSFQTVSINTQKSVETNFSILGFVDPISMHDVFDGVITEPRVVNQSTITIWDPTEFEEQYNSGTYFFHPSSTSYLKRFNNDYSATECCGISYILPDNFDPSAATDEMYLDDYFDRGPDCSGSPDYYYYLSGLPTLTLDNDFKFSFPYIQFFGLDSNTVWSACNGAPPP